MIREYIINIRKKHKLTQQQVADYIGISRQAYNNFENKITGINNNNLLKLEQLLSELEKKGL